MHKLRIKVKKILYAKICKKKVVINQILNFSNEAFITSVCITMGTNNLFNKFSKWVWEWAFIFKMWKVLWVLFFLFWKNKIAMNYFVLFQKHVSIFKMGFGMSFHFQNVKGFVSVVFPFSGNHNCEQKSVHWLQIALLMWLWTNNKMYE